MKKNSLLKIVTIVAFIAFIVDLGGPGFYQGFMDGYHEAHGGKQQKVINSLPVRVAGSVLLPGTGDVVKIDDVHSLQHIEADAVLNIMTDTPVPVYLSIIKILMVLAGLFFLISTIYRGYKIIAAISNNQAFEPRVIKHLNRLSYYLLALFILTIIFDKVDYLESSILAKPIALINTTDWHFELLVCGLLVLLIRVHLHRG